LRVNLYRYICKKITAKTSDANKYNQRFFEFSKNFIFIFPERPNFSKKKQNGPPFLGS